MRNSQAKYDFNGFCLDFVTENLKNIAKKALSGLRESVTINNEEKRPPGSPDGRKVVEKMKLQVFLSGANGYAQEIADELAEMFHCKCDQVPPAYQCDREKLVFFVYEKYGRMDKKFVSYLEGLSTDKVQNVALIEISKKGNEGTEELTRLFGANGITVCGTLGIEKGKGLFKSQMTEEEVAKAKAFAQEQAEKEFECLRKQHQN